MTPLKETFSIDAPPDEVWPLLSDPAVVAACIPGAELNELTPDGAHRGKVTFKFGPTVAGYEVLGEWTNEIAALQEYTIDVAESDGSTTRYYVISMMPGDDATGLLKGERLYCDEGFVRALLGPLFDLLQPID